MGREGTGDGPAAPSVPSRGWGGPLAELRCCLSFSDVTSPLLLMAKNLKQDELAGDGMDQ